MAMLLCAFSANAQGGSVAKIGSTEYTTFADAMAAANAATGNVNVEVYGAVEFIDGMELNGSYTAITFTGKSAEAKITINQTAGGDYLTAHGKTVAFNDLILAKANPAWSGNSGHMGNYFSIQGGTVTYTYCTFPNGACTNTGTAVYNNCTFQNSAEYGLWVYDDALVTVNGGTIDSKKGIKVYSEGEQDVTSTLTVQNATFTENVTAKPAVAVGYAQSITLIGNTYNNPTAHVELDSGSDADCEGITFVAQDSEGNDIASTLEMTDRGNSSAPCGVLVDGKIYTTVTTAAAEATEGSTVTLLYNSTEEVELPEGVVLDKNGYTANNVTVATSGVAKVGENVFTTVLEALQYAIDNNAAELKILCDVREKMTIDFDLNINADLTITADAPVKVEFYNDGTSYDFAVGSTNNNTLTIGENVHFDLVDRVIWLGYWGNNVTVVVNGYLGGYQIWHGANTIVKGTLDSHGEAFIMRRDATLTANEGAKVNANYFQIYSGHIVAENATITAGLVWVNNNHNYGNEGTVSFELDNTEFTSNGEVKIYAGEGKIVSVTLENSSSFDAKGVVTLGDNVKVVADATSSIQDANGSVVIPVAKIGDVEYATLAEAVAAAQAGDEIVLLGDVAEDATLPAGVKFNGNGKAVGNLKAGGEITFTGVTKATSFGVQYTNTTVNIVPGACLEITGSGRMVIGHGCTFNITGSIEDAKTADVAALTPSLIMPGASFTGAGVTFNVTNAYIKTTASYCSSSSSASGTFDFNIENSIWEQFGKLAFEAQSVNATVNFDLVESVLNTTSHLVFGVSRGEVVIDNSNVNVGTSRQIENQSTMTIKNGSVVNGAVATSSNAKNPGTLIVEDATYAVTGEFSGSDLGTGTLIVKKGATVSAGSITKANIQIDATGMAAGDEVNLTADLSKLAGTIEVVNNNLDAQIVDGKIVLSSKSLEGEGTAENPYLIETLKDLKFFRDDVNAGNTYAGKTVKVINNIDLNSEAWTPIATFNGVFDGNDKTISNLVVNGEGKSNQGFFGQTNNGEIKNLTINNATVKGRLNVGVVAGTPYTSKYTNIKVTGDVFVEGMAYVGGVGGKNAYANWTDVTVDVNAGSYVKATSTEDGTAYRTYVGGVVGFNGEGGHTFKNISSNIKVIGDVMDIGGIFGIAHYGNKFENVTFSGSVEAAEGAKEVGGIAGVWNNTAGYTVTFTNCAVADGATVMIGTEDVTEKCAIVGGAYKPSNNTAANSGSLIIDGKEAWIMVAKIGETSYATLEEAFAAAAEGETITLLADATPALTSQRAITKAAVIDLGGNTLTLTEDDLYFGTTTFKNGTIVVDPSVKPSTAVFWMFANQTLTFDAVKVVATGVTGTYLIGLDGNNSDLNLLNGSEILIENTTALDLDVICVNASTGNDIVVENSKVNVTNLDGRVFFRGNYTVKDSEVSLAGITKAGFRIEAGQTLSIEGTSTVTIEGEPRDGGIHITDATATYTKAETATVNATVNAPAPAYVAQVGDAQFETLSEAVAAAQASQTVTLLADVETADGIVITDKNLVIDLNGKTYTTTEGASTNNRNFKIEGTSVVTIKNGTMVAAGEYSSGAYGTVRTEGNANVTLEGLKLYNYRGNGLNIKACGSSVVTINDTEIYSNYGGGIESAGGTIEIANVKVEQKGMYTAPYNSMAISVNGGGKVTVNSGTFSTECITAEEANNQGTSHGPWVAGVLNSGGTLIINGGTFSNDNFGENSLATYARGAILADTKAKVEINGGTFNVLKNVIDIQNNLGDANNNPSVVLAGGTYNADPRISASYGSNLITLADGYAALPDLNGNYVVGVKPTATVNNLGMTTIAAGDYSIWNGSFDQNTEDDGDMPLSFVMQFLADQDAEDMATSPYADWYGDFVITFTGIENGSFTADGCYLAGHYGSFGWVKVPVDGMTIDEGARYPVMLGVGLGQKYDYICSSVEDFKCALYLTPEILAANPNIQVKLELAVVDNSKGSDAAASALVSNENVYSVTDYTYDAEDFVVKKDPEVVDGKIEFVDGEFNSYTNDTDIENVEITYKRTIDSDWNALYVPFAIPASELLDNFDIAYINDVRETDADDDGELDGWQMELIKIKNEAAVLKANHPYFVRSKSADYTENNLSLTLTTTLYKATVAEVNCSSMYTTYTIKGLNELRASTEFGDADRVLGYDNGETTWGKMADGYSLKPFRFYLTITNHDGSPVVSSSAQMSIVVRDEDGTTGIDGIYGDENGETVIFDLYGRRVLEPEKGNIYIINGKKVLVK